eukprot:scaffold463_cov242-Pinguiococcus_pyrenoidosus.AAC.17
MASPFPFDAQQNVNRVAQNKEKHTARCGYRVRSTTMTASRMSASLCSLGSSCWMASIATSACAVASCFARSSPLEFRTSASARSTSPGPSNLRSIRVSSSGCSSAASNTGAVA